jgi:hypothetical protein
VRSPARLVVAAVAVCCASVALAKDPPKPAPAKSVTQTKNPAVATPASNGGLVAIKDPVTGQLRQPTAEEIGALLRLGPAAAARPVEERRLPNGAYVVVLDPSFDNYSVVSKGPDGRLVTTCVEGKAKAEQAVAAGQQVPVKEALDEK